MVRINLFVEKISTGRFGIESPGVDDVQGLSRVFWETTLQLFKCLWILSARKSIKFDVLNEGVQVTLGHLSTKIVINSSTLYKPEIIQTPIKNH